MSYIWHGMKELYAYDAKTHGKYPSLKNMILYQEPLHAFVEISDKEARITGMDGHYHNYPGRCGNRRDMERCFPLNQRSYPEL